MARISNNEIFITRHRVDGFSLSYISDNNKYFTRRYIGYGIKEAKKLFKQFVKEEDKKKCTALTFQSLPLSQYAALPGQWKPIWEKQ
jgi:hypothetical protein